MKNKNLLLIAIITFGSYCLNAQTLTFHNGASIVIENGGILTTEGNLEIPNGGIENNGTIRFGGSSAKNFDANGQALKGIIDFNGGTTTLTDRLILPAGKENFGLITITGTGGLNTSNKLTLIIDSLGYTGRIDEITSSASTPLISSSDSLILFTTSGNNSHRLFGNPFKNPLRLSQFFDDTLEFDITGPGGKSNGFSVNTTKNNPSAFFYNEKDNKWQGFVSGSDTIGVGSGAAIYVMNRKGQTLKQWGAEYSLFNRVNISGGFRTGIITTHLSKEGSGWNLVSNPYPSNISISNSKSPNSHWKNTSGSVYFYDKKNKSYITFNRSNGAKTGKMTDVIPMGGAFLVQSDITPDSTYIRFHEGMKTDQLPSSDSNNPHFFSFDSLTNRFGITLTNHNSGSSEEDQVVFLFGNDLESTDLFDKKYDTRDITSDVVNLAILTHDNYKLAISSYPQKPTEYLNEKFLLSFKTTDTGIFSLRFDHIAPMQEGAEIWLRDNLLDSLIQLDLYSYFFRVQNKAHTSTDNRFELTFKSANSSLSNQEISISGENQLGTYIIPNPVKQGEELKIHLPNNNQSRSRLIIFDVHGKIIREFDFQNQQNMNSSLSFNTRAFLPGIYYLQLKTSTQTFNQKLIINP
jgi:hypothetical protein